jgi:hypothetical protein
VREVRASEVRVTERDEARHGYSANPLEAPSGRSGSGEGPRTDFR